MHTHVSKLSVIVFAFLFFTAQMSCLTAHATSFDCDKAQSKTEKLICANPEISMLDENFGKAYLDALSKLNTTQKSTLINDQKYWLKHTRNLCNDSICLKQAYSARLAEVIAINSSYSDLSHKSTNVKEGFCKSIEKILLNEDTIKTAQKATNSRELTKEEDSILQTSKLDFFDLPADYASGVEVLDIDNDKRQEVFAFNISGTGRIANMAAFDLATINNKSKPMHQLFSASAGILFEPYFIQHEGKNYLITTGEGDTEKTVSEIKKLGNVYKQILHCVTKTEIKKQRPCEHAACKALVNRITKNTDKEFTEELWPHKYSAPFGLKVFTHDNPIAIDYDNSGTTRYIWKLGRKDYLYENLYWSWIGEGLKDTAPFVARPEFDTNEPRDVISGNKHDDLRKVMKQHEAILHKNKILKAADKLPKSGEFFFLRHAGLNYWVWSIGNEAAYGETMHIILTKAGKSNYIGSVATKQLASLSPCKNKCVRKLED